MTPLFPYFLDIIFSRNPVPTSRALPVTTAVRIGTVCDGPVTSADRLLNQEIEWKLYISIYYILYIN